MASLQLVNMFNYQNEIYIKPLKTSKIDPLDNKFEHTKIFSSPDEVYKWANGSNETYEHIVSDTFAVKLFWDIDISRDDLTKSDQETLESNVPYMVKILASLAIELGSKKKIFYMKKNGAVTKLTDLKEYNEAVLEMTNAAVVTKSNNCDKISYHVIYPNFLVAPNDWCMLTKSLEGLVNSQINNKHSTSLKKNLLKAIDFVVWKEFPTLRCAYSIKSCEDTSVHTVIIGTFEDSLISWIPETTKAQYWLIPTHSEEAADSVLDDPEITLELKSNSLYNQEVNRILTEVFGTQLEHYYDIYMEGQTYQLDVDYSCNPCPICFVSLHKNNHFCKRQGKKLIISKHGNPKKCKRQVHTLNLKEDLYLTIAVDIYSRNDIKKYQEDHFIIWNGVNWSFDKATYSITSYILRISSSIEDSAIKKELQDYRKRKMVENNLIDLIGAENPIRVDSIPYVLYFQNGCYNILKDEFYEGPSAKEYIGSVNTGYMYKSAWDTDEDIQNAMKDIDLIIDQIQPPTEENKEERELYEIILGSCLYGSHKEYMTFFHGDTMSGKSTSKKIVNAAIGNFMLETNSNLLTEVIDAKRPNPFLAQINHKRALFASELPNTADSKFKIKGVNVKKLTDHKIISRLCYSNAIEQQNFATFIVDTNHEPFFDIVDGAIVRRCLMINFKSAFIDEKSRILVGVRKNIFPIRMEISSRLETQAYRQACFLILKRFFRKHFLTPENTIFLPFKTTPEKFKDFTLIRKIPTLIVQSSTETIDDILPKYSAKYDTFGDTVYMEESDFKSYIYKHFSIKLFGNEIQNMINTHSHTDTSGHIWVKYIVKKHLITYSEE